MLRINLAKKKLIVDASGNDGKSGLDGISGSYPGGIGANGTEGENGQDAQNIVFSLSTDENEKMASVNILNNSFQLPLNDPSAEIVTKANGGNGGHGGNGGYGSDGSRGSDGSNATAYSCGSNGEDGGPGGDGGYGSAGGNGGDAGLVKVVVEKQDTDLLMLMSTPNLSGGQGGIGGKGGEGGYGGAGGQGGSSYTWDEMVDRHYVDNEGHDHHHTEFVTYHHSGGSNGSTGLHGKKGVSGKDGLRGNHGRFLIKVKNEKPYLGLYNLSLKCIEAVESDDGIIEPEEKLSINQMTFINDGHMPMHSYHPVSVSLIPNDWITFDAKNTQAFTTAIAPGETFTLDKPLQFNLNEAKQIPAIGSSFHDVATLQFKATLPRTHKSFSTLSQQTKNIQIRYPVEISTVASPPTLSKDEEAPFVIKIKNISNKPIGLDAKDSRLLEVQLSATEGVHDLLTFNANDGFIQNLASPVTKNIHLLNSNQVAYFVGTLKFHEKTPPYTVAQLNCKLHLGKLNNKTSERVTIQQRNFQIQFADHYQFNKNADFLLITNNHTDQNTLAEWKKMAANLGTSLSIWNTSLYFGLSYTQKRKDGGTILNDMKDKVVIILNNKMTIGANKNSYSTDCLDDTEILSAAKKAHVSTYVIGEKFNLNKAILPVNPEHSEPKLSIQSKFMFWKQPTSEDLKRKTEAFAQALEKKNPGHRYVAFYQFHPEKTSKGCFSFRPTWNLGNIEIREISESTQTHIAYREMSSQEMHRPSKVDTYNIVKLLPFKRKLEYLENAIDQFHANIIKDAILSDLANELLAYGKFKWNGDFSHERLSAVLLNLKTLSEYQFSTKTNFSRENLYHLLLRFEYFSQRLPTFWDKYLLPFFCRRTRLRNISLEKTGQLLSKYFPDRDHKDIRQDIKKNLDPSSREKILNQFAFPYENHVTFDNQIHVEKAHESNELSQYRSKLSMFQEGRHVFHTNETRNECIEEYKNECHL